MPQSTLAIITEMEVVTIEVYILGPAKTLLPRSITIYIVQACKLNSVILHNCSFLSLFFFLFCFFTTSSNEAMPSGNSETESSKPSVWLFQVGSCLRLS